MKISFTGTHSTGKTTLVNKLKENDLFKNYFFDVNVTRKIHENGISINQESTEFSQECNFNARAVNLLTHKNYIGDRSIIDIMAYTDYQYIHGLGGVSKDFTLQQHEKVEKFIANYDILFFLPKELVDFEDDGTRSTDIEYRDTIDQYIRDELCNHGERFNEEYEVPIYWNSKFIGSNFGIKDVKRELTIVYAVPSKNLNERVEFVIDKITRDPLHIYELQNE